MLRLALLENLRRVVSRIARRREEPRRGRALVRPHRRSRRPRPDGAAAARPRAASPTRSCGSASPFVEEVHRAAPGARDRRWRSSSRGSRPEAGRARNERHAVSCTRTDATQGRRPYLDGQQRSRRFALINAMNWKEFVETASVVEANAARGPVRRLRETRTSRRAIATGGVVETVAARSRPGTKARSRARPMRQAEAARRRASGTADRRAHVGYALVDRGRADLERAVRRAASAAGLWGPHRPGPGRLAIYLGGDRARDESRRRGSCCTPRGRFPTAARAFWLLSVGGLIALSALAVSVVNLWVTWMRAAADAAARSTSRRASRRITARWSWFRRSSPMRRGSRRCSRRSRSGTSAIATPICSSRSSPTSTTRPAPSMPADDESPRRWPAPAIAALNERHGGSLRSIFFLFHRPRSVEPARAALHGLRAEAGEARAAERLPAGRSARTRSRRPIGDLSILPTIKYVLTLDADTKPPRDAARKLVGNLAHPLNRPVYDAERGSVSSPGTGSCSRASRSSLESAGRSLFARLSAGEAGLDPYTHEGLGRLSGPLRRRLVRRQGNLRRRCVSRSASKDGFPRT